MNRGMIRDMFDDFTKCGFSDVDKSVEKIQFYNFVAEIS